MRRTKDGHNQYRIDHRDLEERAMPCGQARHCRYDGKPRCQMCMPESQEEPKQPARVKGNKHMEMREISHE